jgi:hypothetical protein
MEYEVFIKSQVLQADRMVSMPTSATSRFSRSARVRALDVKKGRAALFQGCGVGKTRHSLVWAENVHAKTNGDVLILAPLAVSKQTAREGKNIGIKVNCAASKTT